MDNIEITQQHQKVLDLTKEFYSTYQTAPSMRALINFIKEKTGDEEVNSIYLQTLFPDGIAQIMKLAGLPKSARCI